MGGPVVEMCPCPVLRAGGTRCCQETLDLPAPEQVASVHVWGRGGRAGALHTQAAKPLLISLCMQPA